MRDWTILLYLAGDNGRIFKTSDGNIVRLMAGMSRAALADLGEVQQAGAGERVAVLAQLDTLGTPDGWPQGSYRLELRRSPSPRDDVVDVIPETNTGDPQELAKFVVGGMQRCPARRTALVLWNHGAGWKDDDIYAKVRAESRAFEEDETPRQENAAFFVSTSAWAQRLGVLAKDDATRAILYDDTSLDFLTNAEMSQALAAAQVAETADDVPATFGDATRLRAAAEGTAEPLRRLDLIGMDACLMAGVEVQVQVRPFADVLVASQEVEPLVGWPYTAILQALDADPSMTPQQLGALIVQEYARSLPDRAVTLSAVDVAIMDEVQRRVARLAAALKDAYPYDPPLRSAWAQVAGELRGAFKDHDYVDLAEFAGRLHTCYYDRAGADAAVLESAAALAGWLRSDRSPVLAKAATGKYKEANASGITIYLPRCHAETGPAGRPKLPPSPAYRELDFARSGWLELLETVYETS